MVKRLAGKKLVNGLSEKTKLRFTIKKSATTIALFFFSNQIILKYYCANEIRTFTPALVFVIGADVEIYGVTLR